MYLRKRILSVILALVFLLISVWSFAVPVSAEVKISSPSVVLMESSTGKVIYELNVTDRRSPASITKIMTLLLAFEQLEAGNIKLEDQVLVSTYASSMGGSQVYLAEGEIQSLETMIKCITISSGNDASVAVAEHIAGSEEAFVAMMNQKAVELGLTDTHFMDSCGLSDSDEHYTSARDVAIFLSIVYLPSISETYLWVLCSLPPR
ncbi:MAG: D-alanyl-D-alanine carboxypeptidase [Firmicutes bacterium]|nr:D-alanyl-D-alanine carboxypeptidase [Bacillota bacterium]